MVTEKSFNLSEQRVDLPLLYQSNTYRKDLSWLYFDGEPRVQERQQVKNQQSYISAFVVYLTIPSSSKEHQPRHDNNVQCMAVW